MQKNNKFIEFLDVFDDLINLNSISIKELHVLMMLNKYWKKNIDVNVSMVSENNPEISKGTVFKTLKKLRNNNLIQYVSDTNDERYKFIKPTDNLLNLLTKNNLTIN